MPAFAASLTEQERRDLVSYLRRRAGGLNPMRSTRLAIGATIALAVAIMPAAALAHAGLVVELTRRG